MTNHAFQKLSKIIEKRENIVRSKEKSAVINILDESEFWTLPSQAKNKFEASEICHYRRILRIWEM